MYWFIRGLKEFNNFEGRASRKEYWMYMLFLFIFGIAALLLDDLLGFTQGEEIGYIYILYCIALFIPSLALTIRRLHDTERSGWFSLLGLVPVLGTIALLVFMILEGNPGENKFGLNPREDEEMV